MAYIGRGVDKISNIEVLDAITFTDSAGPYNLLKDTVAFVPTAANALVISVDGVIQSPDSYTTSVATITFDSVMAASSTMDFMYQIGTGVITSPSDDSVTTAKLANLSVTAAKIATDAVETAKIKDLNVTVGKLPASVDLSTKTITLPASVSGLGTGIDVTSQITGTVPTANLGSGTANSTTILYGDQTYKTAPAEYDDDALQNDIATLALHQATNANAAKYNLVNTNVDQFEDSSGVSSFTDCARVEDGTQQYVASAYESFGTQVVVPQATGTAIGDYTDGGGLAAAFNGTTTQNAATGAAVEGGVVTNTNPKALGKDWGSGNVKYITGFKWWSSSNDGINSSGDNSSGCSLVLLGHSSNDWTAATTLGTLGSLNFREMTTEYSKLDITRGTGYRYHWVKAQPSSATASNSFCAQLYFYEDPATLVDNATGNFISTATVANASVSKVGIVMTYKNNVGTNTLNTDIVAEVSADGGSNYSTVTLEAAGTFSTGILQAVANDVSVTAGTNIQYRISFANQSASVKEARIYGVSLIY